jgi:hypothetical protein
MAVAALAENDTVDSADVEKLIMDVQGLGEWDKLRFFRRMVHLFNEDDVEKLEEDGDPTVESLCGLWRDLNDVQARNLCKSLRGKR